MRRLVIYIWAEIIISLSFPLPGKPLMPHCVMRRPQAGAELGLEDPGELMPRSVEGNLRGKEDKQTSKRETKEQQRYEKRIL